MIQTCRHWFLAARRRFLDLKLSRKLLLGYLLIILIPSLTMEFWIYHLNYTALMQQHIQNEKGVLQSSVKNLNNRMNQIQEAARFAASNTTLTSYLKGDYSSSSEELYYYIRDIKPLISYLSVSDGAILDMRFHGTSQYQLNWNGQLDSQGTFTLPDDMTREIQTLIRGVWYKTPDQADVLTYYQDIYTQNYAAKLATLEITVDLSQLLHNFDPLESMLWISFPGDSRILERKEQVWEYSKNSPAEQLDRGSLTETIDIPFLNASITLGIRSSSVAHYEGATLLFFLMLIFCLLSLIYYGITTSITRRILSLQTHISDSRPDHLTPLCCDGTKDEIGKLEESYNQMIQRINDLLYQIYHTELEKRDAQFYALQAQIEPHFLYNILENIHMSAEQHQDFQTADMVTSLGKFMRYNLNNDTGMASLADELNHARNYLNIHKIRMGEKLNAEISVYTEIEDVKCPRFILQPLLENAIKHGMDASSQIKITISVTSCAERAPASDIAVQVTDNGLGIQEETLRALRESLTDPTFVSTSHVGLRNINNRLTACYGPGYGLHISSGCHQGTIVTLYLKRTECDANENTCSGR